MVEEPDQFSCLSTNVCHMRGPGQVTGNLDAQVFNTLNIIMEYSSLKMREVVR